MRVQTACVLIALGAAWPAPGQAGPAADGIFLNWNDCRAGAGSASLATFSCLDNAGQHELVAGFRLQQPIDSVIGLEIVIDLQLADLTLPPWWDFQPGGCRQTLLGASAEVAATSCLDPWAGNGTGLVQDYQVGAPRGGANQARIKVVVAVSPSDSARALQSGQDYTAVRVLLRHEKSIGPGHCAGCLGDGCLVLNSMLFKVLPGGSGDVFVDTPAGSGAQQVAWQGPSADCMAVPVRSATWGRLKGLYR